MEKLFAINSTKTINMLSRIECIIQMKLTFKILEWAFSMSVIPISKKKDIKSVTFMIFPGL